MVDCDMEDGHHGTQSYALSWKPYQGDSLNLPDHSKIPNLDPSAGLFVNHRRSLFECDFVSLDSRLESRKSVMDNSFTLGSTEEADNVKILLPQPENSHDDSHFHVTVILRITFDPRKSLDYKVVQATARPNSDLEIQVYSSETGN
ncbi:hypothetical protein Tco_0955830 [Tanacetum coccineum]|uniref:Uncharacterized protein n=1 Tax=Tanacetum coccineum TaxID=301880 RepID=A0ABQ5E8A9_9ASTR